MYVILLMAVVGLGLFCLRSIGSIPRRASVRHLYCIIPLHCSRCQEFPNPLQTKPGVLLRKLSETTVCVMM